MPFPTHEFRMFLAALVRWAEDYPPKPGPAVRAEFMISEPRPIKRPTSKEGEDVPTS